MLSTGMKPRGIFLLGKQHQSLLSEETGVEELGEGFMAFFLLTKLFPGALHRAAPTSP